MENNYVLIKKVHIKTQSKKLYFTRNEGFQFIVFDKNCTQKRTSIRVPKVPFRVFDKLKNEIQNSILRFCFYFNTKKEIQIINCHFHVKYIFRLIF